MDAIFQEDCIFILLVWLCFEF